MPTTLPIKNDSTPRSRKKKQGSRIRNSGEETDPPGPWSDALVNPS